MMQQESIPNRSGLKRDPLDEPRSLLAQLDAETRHEQAKLQRMETEGADHFRGILREALPHLNDGNLDHYTREAGALGAMQEAASR